MLRGAAPSPAAGQIRIRLREEGELRVADGTEHLYAGADVAARALRIENEPRIADGRLGEDQEALLDGEGLADGGHHAECRQGHAIAAVDDLELAIAEDLTLG